MSLEVKISKTLGDFHLEVGFVTGDAHMAVLGASGCGKSMTLRCIAGIDTPDKGRIAVNGRVLFDSQKRINLRPQERRVGYLFQSYALFPNMTTSQNVGCALHLPKADKAQRVKELLESFRLTGLERHYPHQLSGGQQQRVALCRMLACEPEVILLDEPFSALDTHLREQMQLQLMESLRDYRDVIMVTHSRDEAYRLCDDLLILDSGKSIARSGTKALFRAPEGLTVAKLTGCKNLSRIQRMGESTLTALDWGLRLRTAVPIGDDITHVGIRAHDFVPVYAPRPGVENVFPIEVLEQDEDPFEWNLIVRNVDADTADEKGEIWWKHSKQGFGELPGHLEAPAEALLLLTDK